MQPNTTKDHWLSRGPWGHSQGGRGSPSWGSCALLRLWTRLLEDPCACALRVRFLVTRARRRFLIGQDSPPLAPRDEFSLHDHLAETVAASSGAVKFVPGSTEPWTFALRGCPGSERVARAACPRLRHAGRLGMWSIRRAADVLPRGAGFHAWAAKRGRRYHWAIQEKASSVLPTSRRWAYWSRPRPRSLPRRADNLAKLGAGPRHAGRRFEVYVEA